MAVFEKGPGFGHLERKPDGQGASMDQDGLPPMVNIMWVASAESRSVRGASHQPIFMGDCLTICHMYLPCLPREWVTFCVSGTAEVSVDSAWM